MKWRTGAAALALMALAWGVKAAEPRSWTVLCLGDSITACSGDFGCYRVLLAEKLAKSEFRVRFVGTRESDSPLGVLHHEGYGGRTTEFLADNMERWYTENPADIILLHSGHNHFVEEHPVAGIVEATGRIIAIARRINPRVVVMLAQVIPSGKLPKYGYIPQLNRELAALAERLNTPCQPAILVDQATGFDPALDTVADMVHPNERGARKLADNWYAALAKWLSAPAVISVKCRSDRV